MGAWISLNDYSIGSQKMSVSRTQPVHGNSWTKEVSKPEAPTFYTVLLRRNSTPHGRGRNKEPEEPHRAFWFDRRQAVPPKSHRVNGIDLGQRLRDRMQRLLIRNAFVVTMDDGLGDLPCHDVLVEDGVIADVGRGLQVADTEVIDATGLVMTPGFVDTHRHTWETVLRNSLPDGDLPEYGVHIQDGFGPLFQPEDVYASNLLGALGALNAGITTLVDWSHIMNTPDHADEAIRALREAGIRAVFAHSAPNTSVAEWWTSASRRPHPEDLRRVQQAHFSSGDQLLTLAMALRGPEFCSYETTRRDIAFARSLGLRMSVHVGCGSLGPANRAIERLAEDGLLAADLTYIHCATLTAAALRLIADTGGTVSIAAPIEMMMGHGYPPFDRLADLGIRPSLSVDAETNIGADMFTQMRAAFAVSRLEAHDRVRNGRPAQMCSTRDILGFATVQGARACALEAKIGTITPGKEADFVLLNLDTVNVMPVNNVIGAIVLAADTSNVDSVFVAGTAVKRNGALLADVDRVRRLAQSARDRLYAARVAPDQIDEVQPRMLTAPGIVHD